MLSLFAVSAGSSGVSADFSPVEVVKNAWNMDRNLYTTEWNRSNGFDYYGCYPVVLPLNLAVNHKFATGCVAAGVAGTIAVCLLVRGNNNAVADGSEEQMDSNVGNGENDENDWGDEEWGE